MSVLNNIYSYFVVILELSDLIDVILLTDSPIVVINDLAAISVDIMA